jgi:ketosteroid isomerase-like protein
MAKDVVGLVEQLLERVGQQRWAALPPLLSADYENWNPTACPTAARTAAPTATSPSCNGSASCSTCGSTSKRLDAVDDETIVLRMDVTFTARATRRSISLPVVELLTVRAGRVARSEVYVKDTAALLATLPAP